MNQPSPTKALQSEIQRWQIGLLFTLGLLFSGCSLTTPATPEGDADHTSAVNEHAPGKEIWLALARAADAGTIDTTTRLAQYVVVLARNRDLSEQDVAAFDAAFPKIASTSRPLTAADSKALIQLSTVPQRHPRH